MITITWDEIKSLDWLSRLIEPTRTNLNDTVFNEQFLEWIDETGVQITASFGFIRTLHHFSNNKEGEDADFTCRQVTYYLWYQSRKGVTLTMSDETFLLMKLTWA